MRSIPESSEDEPRRKPGRPRSKEAHQAILDATLEILAEVGLQAMSIEQVAARAAVGKKTIYRRWSSKEALVSEAIRNLQADMPVIDTGHLRADLISMYRTAWQSLQNRPLIRPLYLRLLSECEANPAVFQVFVAQLALPRFQQFVQMVEKAQARGEIRQDLDLQLVTDLLIGPILFRWLATSTLLPAATQADLASFSEQMTDLILHCLAGQAAR
ncbi:TetR/AcrR family transcriptional regulator [Ktedonosporobacter rubrisoli]|uniref:TetR/AcrR family transcriptional regulator n=1 Tax=Ktedonosporobacter rubrisoli TaxID=2509675 RepID=A0A4P6JKG9_KTERU|nr:TetR/AcrR family transcriptional regulator [Ktedonosporobacter rubrisoli]QBD75645.1 TetR/AcrR family transcriptional regulator [Ktedonosporobacter rubrisoli]